MNRRQFCLALGALVSAPVGISLPLRSASAIVVFDPSNYSQNVLQAIRDLQSNINEARMITNQVISLANEARNLTALPWDMIENFSGQFSSMFSAVGSINGLMQNLANLESRFEELYPDFNNQWNPVARTSMAEDMKRWLSATRESMLGAARTGAQVLENLPQTQADLEKLVSDSQGAVGILQATQAGNQVAATVAGQLMNLNAQLASYSQAHQSYLLALNTAAQASKNRMEHVLDGWNEPYTGKLINENPF